MILVSIAPNLLHNLTLRAYNCLGVESDAMARKPVLPDVFSRKLTWSERLHKASEWVWLGPLPKTQAERELEAEAEHEKRPKDTIKLNLDR